MKHSTALHWAIFNSNELAMSFILARNANVNAKDIKGFTPLHLAVVTTERTTSLIRMLLMRDANPHLKDIKGRTPLEYAKEKLRDTDSLLPQVV